MCVEFINLAELNIYIMEQRMNGGLPVVSIVGRRNVGKSTLFNTLVKKKIAIVDNTPGLTRDIINYRIERDGASFIISDTPGLDLPENEELSKPIRENAYAYLAKSDLIILLFENPQAHSFDHELLDFVRKLSLPLIIAVNKMDSTEDFSNMSNFYELGVNELIPLSAKNNTNIDILLDAILERIPRCSSVEKSVDVRIALVGKPNSGKSTLLNAFLGFDRAVVSPVAGTTRDAINEKVAFCGKIIELIDTAGLKKRAKMKKVSVDFFSLTRTVRSIEDCDVVIHLIDALAGITDTDKKIFDEIIRINRPVIFAVNKWDAVEKQTNTFRDYKEMLTKQFFRAADFPIISISAKDKLRIHKLAQDAIALAEGSKKRIETGPLNRELDRIKKSSRLQILNNNELKIYYVTQMNEIPPSFKFFVNDAHLFNVGAERFFQKELMRILDIEGIPVKIIAEGKKKNVPGSGHARKAKASGSAPARRAKAAEPGQIKNAKTPQTDHVKKARSAGSGQVKKAKSRLAGSGRGRTGKTR